MKTERESYYQTIFHLDAESFKIKEKKLVLRGNLKFKTEHPLPKNISSGLNYQNYFLKTEIILLLDAIYT